MAQILERGGGAERQGERGGARLKGRGDSVLARRRGERRGVFKVPTQGSKIPLDSN